MANISIPLSLFVKFKDLHGEALAKEYYEVYEATHQAYKDEIQKEVLHKKLELRDELSKELASKADVALSKAELRTEIQQVRTEIQEVRTEIQELRTEIQVLRFEIKQTNIWLKVLAAIVAVGFATSHPLVVKLIERLLL